MEIFKKIPVFDVMHYRFHFLFLSLLLTIGTVFIWLRTGSEKYGVDFLGGIDVAVKFESPTSIDELRGALEKGGIGDATVQAFEGEAQEYSIRLNGSQQEDISKQIKTILEGMEAKKFEILSAEYIGPTVGEEIKRNALWAIGIALVCMLLYVTFRFEFRFALGAIIAVFHDIIIAAGFVVLVGREVNVGVVAALLTVLGYSVNDSVVVFDRIRENMLKAIKSGGAAKKQGGKLQTLREIINVSICETLSRTILTGMAALFTTLCLFFLGSGSLVDIAFTLFVGIVFGTYSSIFVACSCVLAFEPKKA